MTADTDPTSRLLAESTTALAGMSSQWEWAEDEVDAAAHRHPADADLVHHGFGLLAPTHESMATEFVLRSHCRELLDRVVAGRDTRPATAAEICCACAEAGRHGPLTTTAAGLYFRMWATAFPAQPVVGDRLAHYEALYGPAIDDLEAALRHKLAVLGRVLGEVTCAGRHHLVPVRCRYAMSGRPEARG